MTLVFLASAVQTIFTRTAAKVTIADMLISDQISTLKKLVSLKIDNFLAIVYASQYFFHLSNRAVTAATSIAGASHNTHTESHAEVHNWSGEATDNSRVSLSDDMDSNSNSGDARRANIASNSHFDEAGELESK